MFTKTRLFILFNNYTSSLQRKILYLQDGFTKMLCLLFLGFLTGNLFGTFLNIIRGYLVWDGLIGIVLVSLMEIFSYAAYHAKHRPFFFILIYPNIIKGSSWRFVNLFKIGLMIGFFVDAFKVGS